MSFGKNLQFLRKVGNEMTQEELAEKLGVSRQTVSKWEMDAAYPEINKLVEICNLFSCSMDELIREDMNVCDEAYSNLRMEMVKAFRYIKYAVISKDPETDALNHAAQWAEELNIQDPEIIGWDFPFLSQEQMNVFHMHGYEAALILPDDMQIDDKEKEIISQEEQKYIVITIKFLSDASPFYVIPNAYKVLMTHMRINGIKDKEDKKILSCFEKEYDLDGVHYMDLFIAVE